MSCRVDLIITVTMLKAEEALLIGNNNNSETMCWIICALNVFLVWRRPGEVRTGRAAQSHVLSTWAGLTHLYQDVLFFREKKRN